MHSVGKINAARSVPTYKQPFFVIQKSIATKDLGNIYFLLRYATEILRFALNDKYIKHYKSNIMKKELWQKIIHFAITILTAIATTLGTTSCMGMMD